MPGVGLKFITVTVGNPLQHDVLGQNRDHKFDNLKEDNETQAQQGFSGFSMTTTSHFHQAPRVAAGQSHMKHQRDKARSMVPYVQPSLSAHFRFSTDCYHRARCPALSKEKAAHEVLHPNPTQATTHRSQKCWKARSQKVESISQSLHRHSILGFSGLDLRCSLTLPRIC